jgi:hypothetical protein
MIFKEELKERGLKLVWVAKKIECNYQSFKVYVNNQKLMPEWVCVELKELLK